MPRLASALHVDPAMELDYVAAFQALARVQLEIQSEGPRADRLLRKAWLEAALGDHTVAEQTAEDACLAAPASPEARFVRGEAQLYGALSAMGLMSRGAMQRDTGTRAARDWMAAALASFESAARLSPEDPDAQERCEVLRQLVDLGDDADAVRAVLQRHHLLGA